MRSTEYQGEDIATRSDTKMTFHRRCAYASTDAAGNLIYCTITSFAMYYYTDVFGISVASAGLIMLIARLLDALDAPMWGVIIDHTRTRWGQSRPWWLWLTFPFMLSLILVFWSPQLASEQSKFWWALVTYLLAGVLYTGIATPITAILPNLSKDSGERIRLNSYRMIGGMVGFLLTATFTLELVQLLGNDEQTGWRNTAILWGAIGAILLIFAFLCTREVKGSDTRVLPVRKSFAAARNNWPWVILVIAATLYWIGNTSRISAMIYFTEYNLGDRNFTSVLNSLLLFQVAGMISIPFLVKFLSKTSVFICGLLIAAGGQVCMSLAGDSHFLLGLFWSVEAIGTGIAVSMPFAMLADTVDYGHYKNGVRGAGFLTAIGSAFSVKLGSGLGGWFPALIMNHSGYIPNTQQSAGSLKAIELSFIFLPAAAFTLAALIMVAYYRYERQEKTIKKELAARSSQAN